MMCHNSCGACSIEGIKNDIVLIGEQFQKTLHQMAREHGGVIVFLHVMLRRDWPLGINPLFEFRVGDINIICIARFFQIAFAENLNKFPCVFEIRTGRTAPTAPRSLFAIVVIFLPQNLTLPDESLLKEKLANEVMARNVIGKQRLHIDNHASAIG